MKNQKGQIGLVGEYAVLSALILNGFNAARMDGNSKNIDILCSGSEFAGATRVQVKTTRTLYWRKKKPVYSFFVSTSDRYRNAYRQAIIDQKIYFVFYLCPQAEINAEAASIDKDRLYGRYFVASPDEVVKQLDAQLNCSKSRLYFRLLEEVDDLYCVKEGGVLVKDFENRWDKLIAEG